VQEDEPFGSQCQAFDTDEIPKLSDLQAQSNQSVARRSQDAAILRSNAREALFAWVASHEAQLPFSLTMHHMMYLVNMHNNNNEDLDLAAAGLKIPLDEAEAKAPETNAALTAEQFLGSLKVEIAGVPVSALDDRFWKPGRLSGCTPPKRKLPASSTPSNSSETSTRSSSSDQEMSSEILFVDALKSLVDSVKHACQGVQPTTASQEPPKVNHTE
jgi:hypothetical protein